MSKVMDRIRGYLNKEVENSFKHITQGFTKTMGSSVRTRESEIFMVEAPPILITVGPKDFSKNTDDADDVVVTDSDGNVIGLKIDFVHRYHPFFEFRSEQEVERVKEIARTCFEEDNMLPIGFFIASPSTMFTPCEEDQKHLNEDRDSIDIEAVKKRSTPIDAITLVGGASNGVRFLWGCIVEEKNGVWVKVSDEKAKNLGLPKGHPFKNGSGKKIFKGTEEQLKNTMIEGHVVDLTKLFFSYCTALIIKQKTSDN